jgi:hypothetical protein
MPGFSFTAEQKNKIIQALQQRGAILPCSRCGQNNFGLHDAFVSNVLGDGKNLVLGGPAIPSVLVVCANCGAIYQHAVGTLGLFEEFGFTGTSGV